MRGPRFTIKTIMINVLIVAIGLGGLFAYARTASGRHLDEAERFAWQFAMALWFVFCNYWSLKLIFGEKREKG